METIGKIGLDQSHQIPPSPLRSAGKEIIKEQKE
jgi:hypothetical protein